MFCCLLSAAVWQKPHLFTASLPPPSMVCLPRFQCLWWTKSPGHQVCWTSTGSAHIPFILTKNWSFRCRGVTKSRVTRSAEVPRFNARNHQFTLENQADQWLLPWGRQWRALVHLLILNSICALHQSLPSRVRWLLLWYHQSMLLCLHHALQSP